MISRWTALLLIVSVAACFRWTGVEGDQLGPPEAIGADAVGPVQVVAEGEVDGTPWRFSTYRSAEGLCTQLETGSGGSAGCGDLPPAGERTFSRLGWGPSGDLMVLDALVGLEVDRVVVTTADGRSIPARLVPVEVDGTRLQVALVITHDPGFASIAAFDSAGEVPARQELG